MPENTVKVSRPSLFGPMVAHKGVVYANPAAVHFVVRITSDAAEAYRLWLDGQLLQAEALELYREKRALIMQSLHELRGKNLACWCRLDQPCHADVLLELANATETARSDG